jgi:hypothetical protein
MSAAVNNRVVQSRLMLCGQTQQICDQPTGQSMTLFRVGRRAVGKAGVVVVAAQILMLAAGALTILPSVRATAKTPEACAALQAKYP